MSDIEVRIGASDAPVLREHMRSRARVSVIRGPLGSGKTVGTVQRILAQMAEQEPNAQGIRPTRWLAVRNTYGDLTQTTIKDFLSIFEGLGHMRTGGLEPPNFEVRKRLADGTTLDAQVIFLALDRDDALRKLRGYQITGIWWNEMAEIGKALVDMGDLRHGRYPSDVSGGVRCTWHGMVGDTNAPDEEHWLARLELAPPEGWEFRIQPGGVLETGETAANGQPRFVANPAAENLSHLPEGYYERGMAGKEAAWIRVMLANKLGFVRRGMPVHPAYRDDYHCAPAELEPNSRYPLLLGLDFGRTPACAMVQYWDHLERWVVIDEMTSENMSAAIFAPQLKRYLDRRYPGLSVRAWGDPAGDARGQATEDTPILICRAAGIPVQPAPSNVWALRIAAVDNPLLRVSRVDMRPGLIVSPRAKMIRKGLMGGYCYRKLALSGPERFDEQPDKNEYSHCVEALHYALGGAGEGRAALQPAEPQLRGREPLPQFAESTW